MSRLALPKAAQQSSKPKKKQALSFVAKSSPADGTARLSTGVSAGSNSFATTSPCDSWTSSESDRPSPPSIARKHEPKASVATTPEVQRVPALSYQQRLLPQAQQQTRAHLAPSAANQVAPAPCCPSSFTQHAGISGNGYAAGSAATAAAAAAAGTPDRQDGGGAGVEEWGGVTQPRSELYDDSSDEEDGDDFDILLDGSSDDHQALLPLVVCEQPLQEVAVARQGAAPVVPCPFCKADLGGLALEARQQHANACGDTEGSRGGSGAWAILQHQHKLGAENAASHVEASATATLPPQGAQPQHSHQQQGQKQQQRKAEAGRCPTPARPLQSLPPTKQQQQQQQQQQQEQCCKVCGTDLGALHYLQAVAHVKGCLAGKRPPKRPVGPPARAPSAPLPSAQQGCPPAAGQVTGPPAAPNGLLQQDFGQWLEGLGLGHYRQAFEEQEVELSIVHLLSAEELRAEVGMTDRLHQLRFLEAARAVAAASGARYPVRYHGGPAQGRDRQDGPAPKRQAQLGFQPLRPKQQLGGCCPGARSSSSHAGPEDQAVAARRRCEQQLLQQLFPHVPPQRPQGVAGSPALQATPPLGRSRLQGARGRPPALLWQSAAACRAVAPRVEERVQKRRGDDGQAAAAAHTAPLARGGSALPTAEESRGTKRVKLEALRQELAMHEQTAAELRRMIADLEDEVGEQQPP